MIATIRPEWLIAWLKDPQGYLEHTRMPRFEWTDKDLYQIANQLRAEISMQRRWHGPGCHGVAYRASSGMRTWALGLPQPVTGSQPGPAR